MSLDLSWLWQTLNAVTSSIQSWFSSIWETVSSITNTGQGVFAGLANLGSSLWDAIVKAFQTLGQAFVSAFNWIWQGLKALGETLGTWLTVMGQWISMGIQWVSYGFWTVGSWLYNALAFIWNWLVNALAGVWNALTGFFSGIQSAIGGWWNAVVSAINAWFTNLVVGIRRKILKTIMVDVSIFFGWKSVERLINASSLKDAGFSIMGLLASPLVGYLFGSIANGLIPSPSTEPIQLIPSIPMLSYSPPSMLIEPPIERMPPSPPPTPTIPTIPMAGLPYDLTVGLPTLSCQGYTASSDRLYRLPTVACEQTLDLADNQYLLPSLINLSGVLYEQNSTAEMLCYVYGNWVQGFTFTPQVTHKLVFLLVKCLRCGSPQGNLIIQFYNVDANGFPTGEPLLEMAMSPMLIPTTEAEIEIPLPTPLQLYADTPVAVIFRLPQGNYDNNINFRASNQNPYARGWRLWSNNGGQTWNRDDSGDFWFKEYGA